MSALVVAIVALSISAAAVLISMRQLRETRKANSFPATVDLFREYRSTEMVAARRLLRDRATTLDPSKGVRGQPDDVAQAVLRVGHYLDNLGVQLHYGLIEPELVAGFLGDSTLGLWSVLQPLIVRERELREPSAYLSYFEHLAETLRRLEPPRVRTELLTWDNG
jgi:hypothetical protein